MDIFTTFILDRWKLFLGGAVVITFMMPAVAVSQSLDLVNFGSAVDFTILSLTSIAQNSNESMKGRILERSGAVTVNGTSILPTELVAFTATANRMNTDLWWSTVTEINNVGFAIERTKINNDYSTTNHWNNVGFVEGAGISNVPKEYSFTDKNILSGNYYYRLKQIERNGKISYSKLAEVIIENGPKEFSLVQNYPNPFNPSTKIEYSLAKAAQVSLKVYNLVGFEVATLVNSHQEAGSYTVPFNTNEGTLNLPSGVYFYRLEAGSIILTKKLTLMK